MNVYPPSVLPADAANAALGSVVLRLADDHLVLGHRLSQWCGHAPMLEEDLSMPNMALDVLGQALALYEYLVELNVSIEGDGTDRSFDSADALAYLRVEREYVNCLLVEKTDVDFAHAMLKQPLLQPCRLWLPAACHRAFPGFATRRA